jgi:hypothetical protein
LLYAKVCRKIGTRLAESLAVLWQFYWSLDCLTDANLFAERLAVLLQVTLALNISNAFSNNIQKAMAGDTHCDPNVEACLSINGDSLDININKGAGADGSATFTTTAVTTADSFGLVISL